MQLSFPSLNPEFYAVFANRIKENGFSNDRLSHAVKHVIDNCVYPQPTIAQFISYDKKVKLYNYAEYGNFVAENRGTADATGGHKLMKPVRVNGISSPMWAMVSDIELYGLELFNKLKL